MRILNTSGAVIIGKINLIFFLLMHVLLYQLLKIDFNIKDNIFYKIYIYEDEIFDDAAIIKTYF